MPENLFSQLRDNHRLRWGVLLMLGLFWLYAIILMQEAQQETTQQYRSTTQSVTRLREQLAQPDWLARVTPAQTMAVQMEGRLWQAPTPGLAQAAFQDWLNASLTKVKQTRSQLIVTVDGDNTGPSSAQPDTQTGGALPPLWKITAKVSFDFTPANLLEFMNEIEGHDKQIIISSLNVRRQPTARVEIELFGYFLKQDALQARPHKELVPF
jgi:hypothetical protein